MININKLDNNIDHINFEGVKKFDVLIADDIKSEILKLFEVPSSKVIIDLTGVEYIDSSGFGCFLSSMKAARNNYGKLKICNIDPEVMKLFRSLQLHTVLELWDDLDSCKDSF